MNEEEKQAIETMKHWIEYEKSNKDKINKADELIEIQETVLNLLEKKDKIIDKMAEEINKTTSEKYKIKHICEKGKCIYEECHEDDWNECIKQYFERKVEEDKQYE